MLFEIEGLRLEKLPYCVFGCSGSLLVGRGISGTSWAHGAIFRGVGGSISISIVSFKRSVLRSDINGSFNSGNIPAA